MADFRYVPWKRNLNKVPPGIIANLRNIAGDLISVGVTRAVPPSGLAALAHLPLPTDVGAKTSTHPLREMGKFSERNADGWEVVRRDLPKIDKTFYWETPNFGDAATYGTHLHAQEREVYQREWHEPRMYQIVVTLLKSSDATGARVFHFEVDQHLSRSDVGFDAELLLMLNLLQENCGAAGVSAPTASDEDHLKVISLDWQVFPPGSADEVVKSLTEGRGYSAAVAGTIDARVRLFSSLKPKAYLRGTGGFGSYVGALYADDLVVFENVRYGNALYVLYDGWAEISKRSRSELLKGTDDAFDRLPHRDGWEDSFKAILQREKRARRLS